MQSKTSLTPQLEKKLRAFRNEQRKDKPKKKLSHKERNALLEQEIAKLYEGQSFDNWLHLFDEIDAYLPSSGKERITVQNDIKRWMELEKDQNSQKLTIKQIYAEPIEKVDGRKKGNHHIVDSFKDLPPEELKTKTITYKEKNNLMQQEISKLSVGQRFKDWRILFNYLDLQFRNGPQRFRDIDHLKQWINVKEYEGHYYKDIIEIYEKPHILPDKRTKEYKQSVGR